MRRKPDGVPRTKDGSFLTAGPYLSFPVVPTGIAPEAI